MLKNENRKNDNILVSVVIPIYNEENGLNFVTKRVVSVFKGLANHEYELILVDDCSTDQSLKKIVSLSNNL